MNRIVWVMGESATGKATFIRYAAANPTGELMRRLGYSGSKIIPIVESMTSGDRDEIVSAVLDLLGRETDAVFLIKWQAVDSICSQHDTLRKLASKTPGVPGEIILLSVESDILYARVQRKCWWNDPALPYSYYTQERQDENSAQIKNHAKELSGLGFKMIEIDSTEGYRLTSPTSPHSPP